MSTWDGWDGWDSGPTDGAAAGGLQASALARSREALVYGRPTPLARPPGWPGQRPGEALRGLGPAQRHEVVLFDLLSGCKVQARPQAQAQGMGVGVGVTVSHGRMQHNVSAAGVDFAAELDLVEAKADLRPERLPEISAQLQFNPVFWAAILPISPQRTPNTLALMQVGVAYASFVVQRVKAVLNLPRPADLSPRIQPIVATPAFSGFPSGHATQAALLAGLLFLLVTRASPGSASWGPTLKPMLDELAARIAENREIAGVHFPADSAAGKALGDKLLSALLEIKSLPVDAARPQDGHAFAWLWQQAAAEWGAA
jgi:hypothetical protein